MAQRPRPWQMWLSLSLGTTLTLILVHWSFRDIHWPVVWQQMLRAQWRWLLLGWLAYLGCYGVRAQRWGTLLNTQTQAGSYFQRLTALLIGYGANSLLPAYFGEMIRCGLLRRTARVPFEASLGSIFAERMLDLGVVLLLLGLPLSLRQVPHTGLISTSTMAGLSFGLLGLWGGCVWAAGQPQRTVRGVGTLLKYLGLSRWQRRVQPRLHHFLAGLTALGQPRRFMLLFGQTLLAWLLNGLTYWSTFAALQSFNPGVVDALFIQSGTALAIAVPSTPGYIGPFEASLRVLLAPYPIPTDTVVSYALLLRFLMYVTIPFLAIALLPWVRWHSGISKIEITAPQPSAPLDGKGDRLY